MKKNIYIIVIITVILLISLGSFIIGTKYGENKEKKDNNLNIMKNNSQDYEDLNTNNSNTISKENMSTNTLNTSSNELNNSTLVPSTLKGIIKNVKEDYITIENLAESEISYKGRVEIQINDNTQILLNGTEINLNDLKDGDKVKVTFIGKMTLTSPAIVDEVQKIEIIE